MSDFFHYASKYLNKVLLALFVGMLWASAWAQDGATAPQKPAKPSVDPNSQKKIKFDDLGKLLTEKDLKTMLNYTVYLMRKHGFRFHFMSGGLKDKPIDDILEELVRFNGVGATPDDRSAFLLVLCNKLDPKKKTELRLRLGNGWNDILSYEHFNYAVQKYVQPVLAEEPVDAEKLSNGIMEVYTRMISVAIGHAKEKGIFVEETQPKPQAAPAQSARASSDDAMAARVIADATAKATNDSGNEEATTRTMRALPQGLRDPGIPPAYSGELPPKPETKRYVCDWGDLLTPSDRAYVEFLGQRLDSLTTAELVLVTVPSRGDLAIKDFSIKIANSWGIGKADKDNGCMLLGIRDKLLARQSGKIRIEVGRYLEGRLNDAKCGRILDELALPPFSREGSSKEAQSAGLVSAYEYLAKEIATEYKADLGIKINVYKLPEAPQGDFLISDGGHVLTAEDLATVEKLGRKLQEKTGKRLILVSLSGLNPQFDLSGVCDELQDRWRILSSDKPNTMLLLFDADILFEAKGRKSCYSFNYGSNISEAMASVSFLKLFDGIVKKLKKEKGIKDNNASQPLDKELASHALRDFYVCLAQKIAAGKKGDGAKILELPEGTVSCDDFKDSGWYTVIGAYIFVLIILLFVKPMWAIVFLLWPVALVMLFFPKGRELLADILESSSGGIFSDFGGSSSDDNDRSYRRSSYGGSSSSSSRSSYGGGSFGGGGADR